MVNIVADREGIGAGVLIRACAPVQGNVSKNAFLLARYQLRILWTHYC